MVECGVQPWQNIWLEAEREIQNIRRTSEVVTALCQSETKVVAKTVGLHEATVEPLNNGHIWTSHFVHCRRVVLSLEVKNYYHYRQVHYWCIERCGYLHCLLYLECPF